MAELAEVLEVTDDDRLDQAEALVRSYCGWHIARSRPDVFRMHRLEAAVIILPSLYVTSVESVTLGDELLTLGTDYTFTFSGVISLWRLSGWRAAVEVHYSHGYDEPPADVSAVVLGAAQRAIDNPGSRMSRTRGPFSDVFASFGQGAEPTAMALTGPDKQILNPYRLAAKP